MHVTHIYHSICVPRIRHHLRQPFLDLLEFRGEVRCASFLEREFEFYVRVRVWYVAAGNWLDRRRPAIGPEPWHYKMRVVEI